MTCKHKVYIPENESLETRQHMEVIFLNILICTLVPHSYPLIQTIESGSLQITENPKRSCHQPTTLSNWKNNWVIVPDNLTEKLSEEGCSFNWLFASDQKGSTFSHVLNKKETQRRSSYFLYLKHLAKTSFRVVKTDMFNFGSLFCPQRTWQQLLFCNVRANPERPPFIIVFASPSGVQEK